MLSKSSVKKLKKKCEICHTRTGRINGQKQIFMARFPLNPDRCRRWVSATGNEDLIYLPIEKLNQLKYICGKHFQSTDLTENGRRLKKHAVPTLNIASNPLPDHLFDGFPYHMASHYTKPVNDHDYCNFIDVATPGSPHAVNTIYDDQNFKEVLYEPSSAGLEEIEIKMPNKKLLQGYEIVGIKLLLRKVSK